MGFPIGLLWAYSGLAQTKPDSAQTGETESLPVQEAITTPSTAVDQRAKLNLVGQTDTQSGENRRNDNVQLTPLDNSVLKDLNQRIGTTATLVRDFTADRSFFSSEYGNPPTMPLQIPALQARPGIHGSFYETHLNSVFSARSFFQVGGVKPGHENQYGFDVTAPLWRKATISVQGSQQKIRKIVNGNVLVPLLGERTALATDPRMNAFVQRLLDFYPKELPNRTDIDPRMLNTNSRQTVDGNIFGAQLDQAIGTKQLLSFRYQWVAQKLYPFEFVAGKNPDTTTRSHQARAVWTRQFSPSTVVIASLGFDRVGSLVIPDPSYTGPSIATGGLSTIGTANEVPVNEADNSYRGAAHVRQTRASHELTAGFDLRRRQYNGVRSFSMQGAIIFSQNFGVDAVTNLRLGQATIMYKAVGDTNRAYRSWSPVWYFGDKWQATPNLTLNLGVRYEPAPTPTEAHGRTPIPYRCDCNNLAPQLGLAYRLGGRWGVLRAGYSLGYGIILPSVYATMRYNAPYYRNFVLPNPNILDPLAGLSQASSRAAANFFAPDTVNPYAHQYNFAWEANLAAGWRLQAGYVGSRTFRLIQTLDNNRGAIGPGIVLTSGNIDQRRPNPNYTEMYYTMSGGRSWFDAARATLMAPRWKALTLDVSYWFSKSLDLGTNYNDLSGPAGTMNQWEFESHADLKERSDFDQPHAFLARFAYDLPRLSTAPGWLRRVGGGWSFSGVALMKTGTPFSVNAGSDAPGCGNADGASGDRPNVIDPSVLGRTIGSPDTSRSLLPRSAFAFIQPGDLRGNVGLNVFRKGPIRNLNVRLSRTFTIKGEKLLRFGVESINLFNTAQFAAPGFALTDPNFGAITNTLNEGRTFRLSLRLEL